MGGTAGPSPIVARDKDLSALKVAEVTTIHRSLGVFGEFTTKISNDVGDFRWSYEGILINRQLNLMARITSR